ncbi:MAG: hypothetical protein PUC44_02455 [Eubacteriales bacterium]|nr:hypothetical protein [Eubacteriales bacterium]
MKLYPESKVAEIQGDQRFFQCALLHGRLQLAEREKSSTYISVNLGQLFLPDATRDRSYGVNDSIEAALGGISEALSPAKIL